jgi:hypothetical protein
VPSQILRRLRLLSWNSCDFLMYVVLENAEDGDGEETGEMPEPKPAPKRASGGKAKD